MSIYPDLAEFTKKHKKNIAQIIWAKLPADLETAVSCCLKLDGEKYLSLFESVEQGRNRGRYSFITLDPDLIWSCNKGEAELKSVADNDILSTDSDIFGSLKKFQKDSSLEIPDQLPAMAAGIFGYMSYDMVRYMEKLPDNNKEVINNPESIFVRPQLIIIFDSIKDEMLISAPLFSYSDDLEADYEKVVDKIKSLLQKLEKNDSIKEYSQEIVKEENNSEIEFKSNMSREQYHQMVEKAKEYILAGDVFQVVPSQRFAADFAYSGFELYRVLRRLNPSPYSFYMKMDDFSLVGSSPEILVRSEAGKVTVRPIAGTRKRGIDDGEDSDLAADLLSDQKELAEHLMLIDLGRNDMGRVSDIGSVKLTQKMVIEYYSHVMHIVSNVEGKLRDDKDSIDAFIAGFPVGTVSGAPKIRAMEIIDELENERRSFYAGGVGYFSSSGDCDTCIALRTALVKSGKLYIQAGGGVVADSDPEAEYQESCNKAKALMSAAREVVRHSV